MLVLVVEDDPDTRMVVRVTLEQAWFEVVEAGSAEEALRISERRAVDVVVLDVDLPGASGLDVLAVLRDRQPGVPVIMLTGRSEEHDRVGALVNGAHDYILKPFSTKELAAHVVAASRHSPAANAGEPVRLQAFATGVHADVADAVVVTDADLRIRSFNPAAEVLYGWTESEVVGRPIAEILEWDRDPEEEARAAEMFHANDRWHDVITQRCKDGRSVLVRSSATMLRDPSGAAIGIVAVNRRVRAEAPMVVDDLTGELDALDRDIRRGLDQGEFVVYYQPVVDLTTGGWTGVEALARWEHPTRGLLEPSAFIAQAERSGAIVELGTCVLEEACRQWARWRRVGKNLHVAVNLSGRQLAEPSLVDRIARATAAASMPPGELWLEVTETSLVEDLDQATGVLRRLAEHGANVAIDDFGTGWASLTYLSRFPVDALKIDRGFVAGLGTDGTDDAIVSSILSLGAELGLEVVAEGIETPQQAARLGELGCTQGQGYLYARPAPPRDLRSAS